MLNKKLGIAIIIISVLIGAIVLTVISKLNSVGKEIGCFPDTPECLRVGSFLNFSHIAVGILASLFALGVYLIFFSKSEEAIIKRLENDGNKRNEDEKFEIILKALDEYEKKALKAVKEQNGITQNTLRLRTDMSKAKLSYVLQELEKRNLIKRIRKGKTLAVYLKI